MQVKQKPEILSAITLTTLGLLQSDRLWVASTGCNITHYWHVTCSVPKNSWIVGSNNQPQVTCGLQTLWFPWVGGGGWGRHLISHQLIPTGFCLKLAGEIHRYWHYGSMHGGGRRRRGRPELNMLCFPSADYCTLHFSKLFFQVCSFQLSIVTKFICFACAIAHTSHLCWSSHN